METRQGYGREVDLLYDLRSDYSVGEQDPEENDYYSDMDRSKHEQSGGSLRIQLGSQA
jgi:hypothetical protein